MSQKRNEREESTSFDDDRPRKTPSLRSAILEVMNLRRLQNLMEPVLEPLIRRVVKEEMDTALRKYLISMKRNVRKDLKLSESRSLQLQFSKTVSLPVFTGTRIEGDRRTIMEVALVDVLTGEVVSSGLESSAKVEIVVLEGDFDGDDGGNWTHEEFKNNIVSARERKKSLLNGEVIMTLKNGMSSLGDISFTDNSSWTRSRKFRLGAKFVDNFGDIRVREAISEPFIVRDHRGELYKKHHPPSLSDEVWRLEKIGKEGAFHKRLSKEKVNTVQDFLILLFSNPTKLQNILGTGMSAKMWEITVDHARTCIFDKKLYFYNSSGSLQKNGVIFNMIGEMMGMFSNDQYVPIEKLSDSEKDDAHELVISAFKNRDKIVAFDTEFMATSSCLSFVQPSSNFLPENSGIQDLNTCKIGQYSCSQPNLASPDCLQLICSTDSVESSVDCLHVVDTLGIGYNERIGFPNNLICDTDSMTPFCENEYLQYFETDCSNVESIADSQSTLDICLPCSAITICKTKWGWNVLVSILRWWFSIKRIVARKTRAKEMSRCC